MEDRTAGIGAFSGSDLYGNVRTETEDGFCAKGRNGHLSRESRRSSGRASLLCLCLAQHAVLRTEQPDLRNDHVRGLLVVPDSRRRGGDRGASLPSARPLRCRNHLQHDPHAPSGCLRALAAGALGMCVAAH